MFKEEEVPRFPDMPENPRESQLEHEINFLVDAAGEEEVQVQKHRVARESCKRYKYVRELPHFLCHWSLEQHVANNFRSLPAQRACDVNLYLPRTKLLLHRQGT